MGHVVKDIEDLHVQAEKLLRDNVEADSEVSAGGIIKKLNKAIDLLSNHWEGEDAKVNINDAVHILNGMTRFRNSLGGLAVSAGAVASSYRGIQIKNLANLPELKKLHTTEMSKRPEYTHTTSGVNIDQEAEQGAKLLEEVKSDIEKFIVEVNKKKQRMLEENWTQGGGRDQALAAFDKFEKSFKENYKPTLEKVSTNVRTAVRNYSVDVK